MPMRARSAKSCYSGMALISSPKTKIRPESGRSSPSANLSSTLLPTPAGPSRIRVSPGLTVNEMSSRTGLFSNPMDTFSKTTTGSSGECCLISGATAAWLMRASPAEDTNHETADNEVGCNDEHRRNDNCLCCGPAHTLGAAARRHSVIAPDGGNDESEKERLDHALHKIGIAQRLVCSMKVLRAILSEKKNRNSSAAKNANGIGNDGQEKEHHNRSHDPRHYQLFQRIGTQRPHSVNLLGHHHRAKLAGHARGVAP